MKKQGLEPFRIAALLFSCFVFVAAAVLLPLSGSKAEPAATADRAESGGLPNFDIREDGQADSLAGYRKSTGQDASSVADFRDAIVRGETALKDRLPDAVVEYSGRLDQAEVISGNVWAKEPSFLTEPNRGPRPEVLRNFLKENAGLIGTSGTQIDELVKQADYTNPDGNLSFVHLEQQINGIPRVSGRSEGWVRHQWKNHPRYQ